MSEKKEQSELERVWSVINHDLASPLAVIQGNLKYLDEKLIPELIEAYQKAKAAGLDVPSLRQGLLPSYQTILPDTKVVVDRVRQLVSRWNHKLLSDKFHSSKQPINIVKCVKTGIENYQAAYDLADKSRIHVDFDEATVLGDEEIIRHILYELFANAEYAADSSDENDHSPIVFFSSTIKDKQYHLHMKSIGSPIADADLPKLFDPYFTTKTTHLGLGLTFCRQAMQGMQGGITCRTENNGKTTIFTLTFPRE